MTVGAVGQRRIRVLLADDSPNIQKAVALGLRKLPYDLIYCDNGEDALRLIKEQRPHILLADLEMPGPAGAELCQLIKKDPALKEIRVVLLCGSFDQIDDQTLESLPADARIWKPFETQVLVSVLETVLKAPLVRDREKTSVMTGEVIPPRESDEPTAAYGFNPTRSTSASPSSEEQTSAMIRETFMDPLESSKTLAGANISNESTKLEANPPPLYSAPVQSRTTKEQTQKSTRIKVEENLEDLWGTGSISPKKGISLPDNTQSVDLRRTAFKDNTLPPSTPDTNSEDFGEKTRNDFVDFRAGTSSKLEVPEMELPTFSKAGMAPLPSYPSAEPALSKEELQAMVKEEVARVMKRHFKEELDKVLEKILAEIEEKSRNI